LQSLGQQAAWDKLASVDFQHLGDGVDAAPKVLDRRRGHVRAGAPLQVGCMKPKCTAHIERAVRRQFPVLGPLRVAGKEQKGAGRIALGARVNDGGHVGEGEQRGHQLQRFVVIAAEAVEAQAHLAAVEAAGGAQGRKGGRQFVAVPRFYGTLELQLANGRISGSDFRTMRRQQECRTDNQDQVQPQRRSAKSDHGVLDWVSSCRPQSRP
jgi:hypothetical protein